MKVLKIKFIVFVSFLTLLSACGTSKKLQKEFKNEANTSNSFKGFVLYDPVSKKELINTNGNKYFTPASNVKLFTFYTAYKTLKDSIVGLNYYQSKDSLIIQGTADPTFLNGFKNTRVLDFLKQSEDTIYLVDKKIDDNKFGDGWSWDDYQYYYMPEKSLFPINGNIYIYTNDSIENSSKFLNQNTSLVNNLKKRREFNKNQFYAQQNKTKTYDVPFITSNELTARLLEDETGKIVKLTPYTDLKFKQIYTENLDSIYKKMLVESDNFIAEQLMLIVGNKVSGKYNVKEAINYSLTNYLNDIPQSPRWVDGSGLSRYNLFSPNDMIFLLDKMHHEIPNEKLLSYFPTSEEPDKAFIYAKSGTLSNNYSLSGYLITKKGKTLIFSYMRNHFKESSSTIKKQLYQKLKMIHDNY
jgi:D-alanyl-D-alanine carboxypeptidase/D-alanyl-D-alanine-endopeptidase (penicillin-binding protein 4)